ncbi:MAG: cell division protein ZapA [Muribaculaceae bacterium]|nr:cell division protein ZapA [Muribaculaceae bacterium]
MSSSQQKITIRIADVSPIGMKIPADTEEVVRRAEYNVNKVWNKWRNDLSKLSGKEVLAMVTFQFAKHYYQLLEQVEREQSLLENFEKELDVLLDIYSPDSAKTSDAQKS